MKLTTILGSSLVIAALAFSPIANAQTCDSISAASDGGWQPVATAPKDGRTVEMLETYGVAPWYGLFKWSKTETTGGANSGVQECDGSTDPYTQVDEEYAHSWRHELDPILGKNDQLPDDFDARFSKYVAEHCHNAPSRQITLPQPAWIGVDSTGHSVESDACLFWRPYQGDTAHYTDPTNGAQNTVEYECGYLHMKYNAAANRCEY